MKRRAVLHQTKRRLCVAARSGLYRRCADVHTHYNRYRFFALAPVVSKLLAAWSSCDDTNVKRAGISDIINVGRASAVGQAVEDGSCYAWLDVSERGEPSLM